MEHTEYLKNTTTQFSHLKKATEWGFGWKAGVSRGTLGLNLRMDERGKAWVSGGTVSQS